MKHPSLSLIACEIWKKLPPFAEGSPIASPGSALLPSFTPRLVIIKCLVLEVSFPRSLPVEELPKAYFCLCTAGERPPTRHCPNIRSQSAEVGLGLPLQTFHIPSTVPARETPKPGKRCYNVFNDCCVFIALIPRARISFFNFSSVRVRSKSPRDVPRVRSLS